MFNFFLPHELDFREWKDSKCFPGVNPLTSDFIQHILRPDNPRKLWRHQEEGLLRVIYAYEILNEKELLLNIVTGGGKTAIIAGVIAWLKYCHGIHKFLLLCPNTIVKDRLYDDFENAKVFRDFSFFPPGTEHYTNELGLHLAESGASPSGMLNNGVILGNIHQFYQSNTSGARNIAFIKRYIGEIAIFNDEAHNTPATEYDNLLFELSPRSRFRLDTTATPDRADGQFPKSRMIYEYGISDAQAEVPPIIKNIVVCHPKLSYIELSYTNPETGERRRVDEMDDEFEKIEKGLTSTQWVTDPVPMRKQMQIALDRLNEQKNRAATVGKDKYKPLLFVVAICIKDAIAAREMLEKEFKLNALLVTEQSDDLDREAAKKLGKPGSPYDAVVSVLMLREGWDVPRVSVVLLLRKFSSRVYAQQVVGRGLRLNIRDEDIQEYCVFVDHPKLQHDWLWEMVNAFKHEDVTQGDLFNPYAVFPPPRKRQDLVNPDLLIEIPEPENSGPGIDLKEFDKIKVVHGDYPNWQEILERFEYGDDVEITRVEIDKIVSKRLDGHGFIEIIQGPPKLSPLEKKANTPSLPEAIEKLKQNILDIAKYILAEEGIGSHELGYFFDVLLEHIKRKMLSGKTLSKAQIEDLIYAYDRSRFLVYHFAKKPGLAASIIKYRSEQ